MSLTLQDLIDRLRSMPAGMIQEAGRRVRDENRSAADEIAWWSATVRVEQLIRRQHQRIAATAAAGAVRRAVRQAAVHAGLTHDDPDVVAVARAASDVAGALAAGPRAEGEIRYFLERLGPPFASPRPLGAVPVAA